MSGKNSHKQDKYVNGPNISAFFELCLLAILWFDADAWLKDVVNGQRDMQGRNSRNSSPIVFLENNKERRLNAFKGLLSWGQSS